MESRYPNMQLGKLIKEERKVIGIPDGDGFQVLGVTNKEGITFTGVKTSEDKSKYLRLRPRWFAYNPYRINVGSIGLSSHTQDGIVSPAYVIFSTLPNLDQDYLFYYLKSSSGHTQINFYGNRGSVRSALRYNDLCLVEIPLPPLPEQRRIVAKIDELASKIEEAYKLRLKVNIKVDMLSRGSLKNLIENLGSKYGFTKISEMTNSANGFGFPKQFQGRTDLPYLFIKVSDMNLSGNERYLRRANNTVDSDILRSIRARIYPKGTLIFPKIGGAIATNKRRILLAEASFDNNIMGLIPSSYLEPEWLYYFMLSVDLTDLQAGTSVPAIKQSKVENLEIPLLPRDEQRRIVAYLDGLQAQVEPLKKLQAQTAAELTALLPAILDRAFKGEL